ncbi:MAG: hypothetical protein DHS20C14_21250 [Phycisphaeraceae bacterium]|nr:MAG: hypothetical protein DHS20C14_21250 [Phycisphaeraceae bacterium]
MNPRRRMTWLVYAACVALLANGLGWVSWQVIRLERAEVRARAENERQDAERLALWRMDSLVSPLIAREAARPYFHYRAFVPAGRTYERAWQPAPDGAPLVPSPLLSEPQASGDPFARIVRLHFLIDPDGIVTSPEAPSDDRIGAAGVPALDYTRVDSSKALLGRLSAVIADLDASRTYLYADDMDGAPGDLAAGAQFEERSGGEFDRSVQELGARSRAADRVLNQGPYLAPARQASPGLASKVTPDAAPTEAPGEAGLGYGDAADREATEGLSSLSAESLERESTPPQSLAAEGVRDEAQKREHDPRKSVRLDELADARLDTGPIRVAPFEPAWLMAGSELVFVREVLVDGVAYRQGFWLDWTELRAELVDAQQDLFPDAGLEPILAGEQPADHEDAARRLATVPARFVPVGWMSDPTPVMTPARWSLVLTWIAVLAAAVAIGVVLQASISLSERRGRFVSAVTHELRTPLTTFRLYAGMLADGMVSDETARAEYLDTLKRESGRLSGIVENVLEYARLTRRATGRPKSVGPISPDELLVRLRPGLSRRAEQGGMDLIVSSELDDASERVVHVDPQSVERVLTNLVDNACRYAAPDNGGEEGSGDDADTRIHLDARTHEGMLEFLVSDYGPGVAPSERARIFGEFRRGGAGSRADRSGLGLGLALSRGLAREAGGDLQLVRRRGHGAEFLLTVPLSEAGA